MKTILLTIITTLVFSINGICQSSTSNIKGLTFSNAFFISLTAENLRDYVAIDTTITIEKGKVWNVTSCKAFMVNKDYNPLPAIWGSSDQLQHALGNILANAKDAMIETGGLLTISTSLKDDKVSIQINDTGPGIEPEMLEKIFEPFRGSKGILAGGRAGYAGLGLFAALGVIRSHRGEIKVESKPGEGATFTVILPLPLRSPLEELLPRKTAARPSRSSPGRRAVNKILLADDEEDIADF